MTILSSLHACPPPGPNMRHWSASMDHATGVSDPGLLRVAPVAMGAALSSSCHSNLATLAENLILGLAIMDLPCIHACTSSRGPCLLWRLPTRWC